MNEIEALLQAILEAGREVMQEIEPLLRWVLGLDLDDKDINAAQMAVRAVVVYVTTVIMVRFGKKRFMGRATAFDVLLGIMLGSEARLERSGNLSVIKAKGAPKILDIHVADGVQTVRVELG